MNVNELYSLTKWINDEIVDKGVQQKYQQLHSVLQANTQRNQQSQPFESQKEDLLKTLASVRLEILTKDQISFLSELGITPLVGHAGVKKIEDILYRNAIDIATAASRTQEMINGISQGVSKSGQIAAGLEGCLEEYEDGINEDVLIRVSFLGDASMSNVKDFKDWGSNWHEIGRGIAMAHDATPEDIKIVGAAKGSVILEFLTNPAIATTVGSVIWGALKVAEKVLDIRKKAAEVRNLNLQNKKLSDDLNKAAEEEKENGIKEIIDEQNKELSLKSSDGDKITALNKSITKLVDFIEKGGEVDFVIPDEEESDDEESDNPAVNSEFTQLRTVFEEIKLLEQKIQLLENNTEE